MNLNLKFDKFDLMEPRACAAVRRSIVLKRGILTESREGIRMMTDWPLLTTAIVSSSS